MGQLCLIFDYASTARWFTQRVLAAPVLVDTDVLIWHLRGYPQATRRLDQLGGLIMSAVSYLEILQGIRDKAELHAVKKMLEFRDASVLPLSETITLPRTAAMSSLCAPGMRVA